MGFKIQIQIKTKMYISKFFSSIYIIIYFKYNIISNYSNTVLDYGILSKKRSILRDFSENTGSKFLTIRFLSPNSHMGHNKLEFSFMFLDQQSHSLLIYQFKA